MEFEKLLRLMVEKGGSDLFITAGVPPSMKVNGRVMPVTKTRCRRSRPARPC